MNTIDKLIWGIVFGVLVCSNIYAQKFTTGEFRTSVIRLTDPGLQDTTSQDYWLVRNMLEMELGISCVYQPGMVVIQRKDSARVVWDYSGGLIYEFKSLNNEKYYFLDTMDMAFSMSEGYISTDILREITPVLLPEYRFGLDGWKYEWSDGGSTATLVVAPQMAWAHQASTEKDSLLGYPVIEFGITDQNGGQMLIGITHFSPVVSKTHLFSLDTTYYRNGTPLRARLQETFAEAEKLEESNRIEFGEYQQQSINIGLLKALVKEEALDKDHYSVTSVLKRERSTDVPSILLLGLGSEKGYQHMSVSKLNDVFKRNGIFSPAIAGLLTEHPDVWNQLTDHDRISAICIAAIQDHLQSETTRRQIVENLARLKIGDLRGTPQELAFVLGQLSYEDFFNEVPGLNKLHQGWIRGEAAVLDQIQSFFEIALRSDHGRPVFTKEGNRLKIEFGGETYSVDLNALRSQVYDGDEPISDQALTLDSIECNAFFYHTLLTTLKQMGADHFPETDYSIWELAPPFTHELDGYTYASIIEKMPELRIRINGLYLNQFRKDANDPFSDIGTSFPYHPEGRENQITIPTLRMGEMDSGIDYITTKVKRDFLQFARHNDLGLTMSKSNLSYLEARIFETLYKDPYELIRLFDHIRISLDRYAIEPGVLEGKTNFKEAFPVLYHYFGKQSGEWKIVSSAAGPPLTILTKEGDIVIESQEELLNKILRHLKRNDIHAYQVQSPGSLSTDYYLVSQEQKFALERLFGTDMF